jgi:hypothetical protein
MLSGKEPVLGSSTAEEKDESKIISILKASFNTAGVNQDGFDTPIRFNDVSTADLVVKVMPEGPILFLNKSVVQSNPFFAAFSNFVESNGYAEITAPDPATCSFVIECLYHLSPDERVVKYDSTMFQESVRWFVKRKFLGTLRNANYFMMDDLLSRCYLSKQTGKEKLRIILFWAEALSRDYNRNLLQELVTKYIPSSSLTLTEIIAMSSEFHGTFDIAVPASLCVSIAACMFHLYNPQVIPPAPIVTVKSCISCSYKKRVLGFGGFGGCPQYLLTKEGYCGTCRQYQKV